ncbi:hypothetical protein [Aeoliella mucimassa]|uniref:Carboxypeptidase regulatory-like domain-containing protein n=1 Tax=Aeoliella mucimassa TaxID=2527972 RepID=A0A518AGL4_9BACT|nr:hypothetical protein [Aeoliella mucimassa]QDU53844.1 hypothetical protein Pan181_00220 [Aeoliella mucimassa]
MIRRSHSKDESLVERNLRPVGHRNPKLPARWMLLAALLTGCLQGCDSGRPAVYPVTGSVSYSNGMPLRTGYVEFLPTAGGPSARAAIERDGTFALSTYGSDDGAIAGDYIVLVTQSTPPMNAEVARKLGPEHEDHSASIQVVSLKYASRTTSDLKCTVAKQSENHFELTVESE